MKKIIFMVLLSVISSITISSCTEEAYEPRHEPIVGGGGETGKI
jgi:hypothetical protein